MLARDQIAKIGDIDVKIYRCRILDLEPRKQQHQGEPTRTGMTKSKPETVESVPEKALKGKAMSAHATYVPHSHHTHEDLH